MLGLMGFSDSLPLYVIHRYYIFVFIDRANKDACLYPTLFYSAKVVILSVSRITREPERVNTSTSTKHGTHEQRVTIQMWMWEHFFTFLNIDRYKFLYGSEY